MAYIGKLTREAANTEALYEFVATEGQTTFECSYSSGHVEVHLNGVLLSKTEYDSSSGTNIILNVPASADDIISIRTNKILGLVDGMTSAQISAQITSEVATKSVDTSSDQNVGGVKNFTSGIKTQGQNISPFNSKNYIINGNFDIWQRGDGNFTSGYFADMWQVTGVNSVGRNESGSPIGSNSNAYVTRTSAGTITLETRIESINSSKLYGKQATLSFWHNLETGSLSNVTVGLYYANTKDNFSSNTLIESKSVSIVNGMNSVTFNALPSSVKNGLRVAVIYTAPEAVTFRLTQVQLEEGTTVTPFEQRPIGMELNLCQRYYEKSYNDSVAPGTPNGAGLAFIAFAQTIGSNYTPNACVKFNVPKRVTPTIVVYDKATGSSTTITDLVNSYSQLYGFHDTNPSGFTVRGLNFQNQNGLYRMHYTASAEL